MQTFTLAGTSALVSDRMSLALLEFVAALSRTGEVASVFIPVVSLDGRVVQAKMNLSASSQLLFVDRGDAPSGLADDAAIDDIVQRTAALNTGQTLKYSESSPAHEETDLEI